MAKRKTTTASKNDDALLEELANFQPAFDDKVMYALERGAAGIGQFRRCALASTQTARRSAVSPAREHQARRVEGGGSR